MIERSRNQILASEVQAPALVSGRHGLGNVLLGEFGQRVGSCQEHLVVDSRGAHVQGAAEDEGKAEDVVHLVGVVRSARGHDHVVANGESIFRQDLRIRVGHREHDRLVRHRLDHLRREHAADAQADEHVRPDGGLCQGLDVRVLGVFRLRRGKIVPLRADHALRVREPQVLRIRSQAHVVVGGGDGRGPRPGEHDLHLVDLPAR